MIAGAMKEAGADPALIHAFEKTGRIVTAENRRFLSPADLAEWDAAIKEYRRRHEYEQDAAGP